MASKKKTEEKIAYLKRKLNLVSAVLGHHLPDEIKELRHFVLFSHSETDLQLHRLIAKKLFKDANPNYAKDSKPYQNFVNFAIGMMKILNPMSLIRKLELANKIGIIRPHGDGLYEKIDRLNKIRNELAHPNKVDYQKYMDREEYKKVLELVVDVGSTLSEKDIKSKLNLGRRLEV